MKFLLPVLLALLNFIHSSQASQARPNILWLTTEDMSPNLGSYGDRQAYTPRLDAFAKEATRYTRAFSTAPVCSPARSCLITGMYATSLGTQRLRSEFPVPAEIKPFTASLRDAGYYCTNNVKTDYNLAGEEAFIRQAWDESSTSAHWRKRKAHQPFFSVFNCMTTHQSRTSAWTLEAFEKEVGAKLSSSERHDAAQMSPPPFYPNTDEAHRAWARYHDCITLMDRQIGEQLDQLEADGLKEDTIVFFFADHGMGMPRGKRCLHDSGLQVPLLIRIPQKWKHLAPSPGATNGQLVSFVDFAPTVLSLCGVKPPVHLQGKAFLGPDAREPRTYVHGARDRVDEAFDVSRSVRDSRWLYIRNFMPHLSWMQPEGYSDTSTFRQELKKLAAKDALTGDTMAYAAATRPLEELYDTEADPFQLHNLAHADEHRTVLETMRSELRRWQLETQDAGFYTEAQWWNILKDKDKDTPWDIVHNEKRYPLERLLEVADTVGRSEQSTRQREWLKADNDGMRYWAAIGLHANKNIGNADRAALQEALQDSSMTVRIEAASALCAHGQTDIALPVLKSALRSDSLDLALHAARALELLGPKAESARPDMQARLKAAREQESSSKNNHLPMFIRFSLEAALAP